LDDYRLRLRLVDSKGETIAESIGPMSRFDHPPSRWKKGELTQGRGAISAPAAAEQGTYELRLSVLPSDSDRELPVGWALGPSEISLADVEVKPFAFESQIPEIQTPVKADFGIPSLIEFQGYGLSSDKGRLDI
jgi:hypothetical protein